MKILHTITTDSPDGQPWPPPPERDETWVLLGHAAGLALWRAILLIPSDLPPPDAHSALGGMQQKGNCNGN